MDRRRKAEVWNGSRAAAVNPLATYLPLDLSGTLVREPESIRPIVERLLERFANGELHPLPKRVFDLERASDAFRHMARARHIGKVVITPRTTEASRTPVSFSSESSYPITRGLSGPARRRMDGRPGARHLALMGAVSRPNRRQAMARMTLPAFRFASSVATWPVSRPCWPHCTNSSETMPLRGVIHSAGVLDDGVAAQDWDRFGRVMAAKVRGAWNLHSTPGILPLDFFVMFSRSRRCRIGGADESFGGQRLPRCAGASPSRTIIAGAQHQLGRLERKIAAARRGADRRAGSRGVESFSPIEGLAAFEWLLRSSLFKSPSCRFRGRSSSLTFRLRGNGRSSPGSKANVGDRSGQRRCRRRLRLPRCTPTCSSGSTPPRPRSDGR